MSDLELFRQAQLLRIRCDLEQLVTQREGMIAENAWSQSVGKGIRYGEEPFERIAQAIAGTAPDPQNFS